MQFAFTTTSSKWVYPPLCMLRCTICSKIRYTTSTVAEFFYTYMLKYMLTIYLQRWLKKKAWEWELRLYFWTSLYPTAYQFSSSISIRIYGCGYINVQNRQLDNTDTYTIFSDSRSNLYRRYLTGHQETFWSLPSIGLSVRCM